MNQRSDAKSRSKRSLERRLAEWISLAVSVLLILGTAAYLAYHGVVSEEPFVPVTANPQFDEVRQLGDRYILPVKIENAGAQTLRDLKVEVEYHPPQAAEPQRQDFLIDYLSEKAEQTIYVYFEHDPKTLKVKASPVHYRLE